MKSPNNQIILAGPACVPFSLNFGDEERSVTDHGIAPAIDLGSGDLPSSDDLASLDTALDEAGVGLEAPKPPKESGLDDDAEKKKAAAAAPKPLPTPPKKVDAPAATGALDLSQAKPIDAPTPPAKAEPTDAEKAAAKAKELETLDLTKIEAPADVSPKNQVNFGKLREVAAHFKTKATTLEGTVAELGTKLKDAEAKATEGKLTPEQEKEITELREWRKAFDTENDPEFKKQYDGKIEEIDNGLMAYLRANGLAEDDEKKLRAHGIGKVPAEWWDENVLKKLPFDKADIVRDYLKERTKTGMAKAAEIQKFQEQRPQMLQKDTEAKQVEAVEFRKKIDTHIANLVKDVDWARPKEIPADATPEVKTQIEAHNKNVEEVNRQFEAALFPETPEARAEVAAAAVAAGKLAADTLFLQGELAKAKERETALTEELTKIKSAGKPPKSAATNRGPEKDIDTSKLSDSEAIDAGLDAALGS